MPTNEIERDSSVQPVKVILYVNAVHSILLCHEYGTSLNAAKLIAA